MKKFVTVFALLAVYVAAFVPSTALADNPAGSAENSGKSKRICKSAEGHTFCCSYDSGFDCLHEKINEEFMRGVEDHSAAFRACGCTGG